MKKVKLFTTIASLCLAVALMAFGVYAATTVSVTVTNTVQFAATANVKAELRWDRTVTGADATGAALNKTKGEADATFNGTEVDDTNDSDTFALGDHELKAEAGNTGTVTYVYNVYIKNTALTTDSYKTLNVEVTPCAVVAGETPLTTFSVAFATNKGDNVTADWSESAGKYSIAVELGKEAYYTVTFTVNANYSVTSAQNLGTSIALTMGA